MVRRRLRRRPCRYCHRLFRPDPHVKERQKACKDPVCKQARKDEGQSKWLNKPKNRDYFSGRYDHLMAWLKKPENVGYLRRYRERRRTERTLTPAAIPPQRPRPTPTVSGEQTRPTDASVSR